MNHNFNLPRKAIQRITEEKKDLLLRLDFPSCFDHRRDILILTDEDSGIVWGTAKIAKMYWSKNFTKFLMKHYKSIAHVQGRFVSYIHRKQGFFILQVYSCQRFK